jgi:hypothetical protein
MNLVLDTCALLALAAGTLSAGAVAEIRRADETTNSIVVTSDQRIRQYPGVTVRW